MPRLDEEGSSTVGVFTFATDFSGELSQ